MKRSLCTILPCLLAVGGAMLMVGCNSSGPGGNANGNVNGDGNNNGNGNDNTNGNDNSTVFERCNTAGTEDDGLDFSDFGSARVVRSTIGEGRHVVLATGQTLVFEFDQPIPFCAIVPENITLRDLTADQDVPLTDEQVSRDIIVDDAGQFAATRINLELPSDLVAGRDYEITFDSGKLGLDGEFQETATAAKTLADGGASNGTLPSGDGTPGGDFVQLFRAIGGLNYLTDTRGAGAMALDASDNLLIVSEQGLYGPFSAAKAVVEGDRLGQNLPNLANGVIAVDNNGDVIVKDNSTDGKTYAVDPSTGQSTQIATADVISQPDHSIIAPMGYASIQRSAVEPGDFMFSHNGSISVLDRRGGSGMKGGLNLVDRAGSISDMYVSLFVPPAGVDDDRLVYGGYKPEEDTGFEMHRILPDGTVDNSVFTNPSALMGVDGTAALKLHNIHGREEYLIVGQVDTQAQNLKQLLPDGFDGRALMIYNETQGRLQVLFPLAVDTFAFTFGPFSDAELTSDGNTLYVSLPSANTVTQFTGFANGADAEGTVVCDASVDDDLGGALATGSARVFRSTLGNGRHLLASSTTTLMFDIDKVVPYCAVTADNIRLVEMGSGAKTSLSGLRINAGDQANSEASLGDISLAGRRIKRQILPDGLGSRIIIDLPNSLSAGTLYELTLNGDALGLDGDFQEGTGDTRRNGTLPSGDGTSGGDFVQIFQLLSGNYFLTETGGAVGIDLDGDEALYASTDEIIMGPFSSPSTPAAGDMLVLDDQKEITGTDENIAGGAMVANDTSGAAAATYASLRNTRLYDIDPVTGTAQIFQVDFGQPGLGSYEIDMVEAPTGFAGDYIVHNESRGVLFDVASANATTLFESSDQTVDFVSLYVTPDGRLLTTVANSFAQTTSIFEVTPTDIVAEFPADLTGATGTGSAQLQDYQGNAEYLILGDWDRSEAQFATGQISDTTTGTELILYNPAENRVQVIGSLSPGADMTFTQDLDTIYTSNPTLRAVLRLRGLDNE